MMQNLTRDQQISLQKAINLFLPDEATKNKAIEYYGQFVRNSQDTIDAGKQDYFFKCAFFAAEKSEYLYNVKGERIKGISFSVNQIIKSCPRMGEMSLAMRQFISKIELPDEEVESEIHTFIQMAELSSQFAVKLQNTFKLFNLEERVKQSFGYKSTFISFAWLLFIDSKNRVLADLLDYTESNCLLAAVCYFMIRYSMEYIRPCFLAEGIEDEKHKKTMISQLIETLLDMFEITEIEIYKKVANSFDGYVERLLQSGIIKYSSQQSDFLSPLLISINYKRLDTNYQKRADPSTIDDRLFLKSRVSTLSPSKFTPMEKNKLIRKQDANSQAEEGRRKNFASHRELNYDFPSGLSQGYQLDSASPLKYNQAKLPMSLLSPPVIKKPPLLCTPVVLGMEAHNYVNKKAGLSKRHTPRDFYKRAENLIKDVNFHAYQDRSYRNQNIQILSFYMSLAESFFLVREETESYHRCLLSFAVHIVKTLDSHHEHNFFAGVESLQPDVLDLWTVCHYLTKFDPAMPKKIKSQLAQIECQIICSELWKDGSLIEEIGEFAVECIACGSIEKAVRCVLRYSEKQINLIRSNLSLSYEVASQAFNCIKYFLSSDGEMLFQRHLDQIIICSLYVAGKACPIQRYNRSLFNDIKTAYEQTNLPFKAIHADIINKVSIDGDFGNIIEFYNQEFVPAVRPFTRFMNDPAVEDLHPIFHNPLAEIEFPEETPAEDTTTVESANQCHTIYSNIPVERVKRDTLPIRPIQVMGKNYETNHSGAQNQTTIRTRPPTVSINFLCDTQKGRNYSDQD